MTTTTSKLEKAESGAFTVTHFQVGVQKLDMSYAAASDIRAGATLAGVTIRSNASAELGTAVSQPKTNVFIHEGNYQTTVLGEGATPNGNYTEVTFSLFQNNTAPADSFAKGKSLYIVGNVNGKTARIWMVAEEPVRVTSTAPNGYEINSATDLMLRFNLNSLFANMNLATALDGNQDGVIDIGPNNVDGNGALHAKIRANLNSAVEFGK
jgi:hypothetical protein